jgi:hypothetical protein
VRARGASRQAGAVTHVRLSQQLGAELHIVLEVERPAGLELGAEVGYGGRLGQLAHAPDTAEMAVRVLRDGETRCTSPVAPAMVVVGDGGRSGRRLVVLLLVEVVI